MINSNPFEENRKSDKITKIILGMVAFFIVAALIAIAGFFMIALN
jgi:flagellar basal body-associated protein FliL